MMKAFIVTAALVAAVVATRSNDDASGAAQPPLRNRVKMERLSCAGGSDSEVLLALRREGATFLLERAEEDESAVGSFELDIVDSNGTIVSSVAGEWNDETTKVGEISLPAKAPDGAYRIRSTYSGALENGDLISQNANMYIEVTAAAISDSNFNVWMTSLNLQDGGVE